MQLDKVLVLIQSGEYGDELTKAVNEACQEIQSKLDSLDERLEVAKTEVAQLGRDLLEFSQ